jgi:hypothetical protein
MSAVGAAQSPLLLLEARQAARAAVARLSPSNRPPAAVRRRGRPAAKPPRLPRRQLGLQLLLVAQQGLRLGLQRVPLLSQRAQLLLGLPLSLLEVALRGLEVLWGGFWL